MAERTERPEDLIRFAEKVIGLLDEGVFVSTYKYAVLVALMDLCLEHGNRKGQAPESVTTVQLAGKVLELYWPQVRSFVPNPADPQPVDLRQSSGRRPARILRLISDYVGSGDSKRPVTSSGSLHRARLEDGRGIKELLREIEWTLVEMPLPKLQRAGRRVDDFLYTIDWNDGIRRSEFESARFPNLIRFQPGVARKLVALAPLLRPLIHRQWALMVTRLNGLPDARLEDFLFGRDRAAVAVLAPSLLELQGGRCFYCDDPVRVRERHVDHFMPWSRHPDDGIANLVVADARCNGSKRDLLADLPHVERWGTRLRARASDLATIADEHRWPRDEPATIAVLRSIYANLPSDVDLWSRVDRVVALDPARLGPVLAALTA